MDYGAILKRTWDITWRYKGLWVLGILAGCSGGGGGGGGGNAGSGVNYSGGSGDFPQVERFFESIDPAILVAVVIGIVLLILLMSLIFIVLGILGQAGLIYGFDQADEGQTVSLSSAFKGGLEHFWRLLGLNLLVFGAGIVLAGIAIAALLVFGLVTLGIGLLCLIPLICLIVPLAVLVNVYLNLTQVAIVVDGLPVFEALRKAWQVARAHVGPVIVMALILVFGGFLVGLILSAPMILLVIPVVSGLALGSDASIGVGVGVAALCFVLYLPVLIVLSGVIQTYLYGAWTVTYRRLTGRTGAALPEPAAA
ncbi:MAG TPA: hypothetical protein VGA52_10520, partial [Anaerolineales bacterium]|jgi:hypothetical protein